ncbi:MAG: phage portal protein [Pseudomonadota bacterium]
MWPFGKKRKKKALQSADDGRGWFPIHDWQPGAWQADAAYSSSDAVLAHSAVFACVSLISSDIAKLRPMLQARQGRIWQEVSADQYPTLTRPNPYQLPSRFQQHWIESKLLHGNAYALKRSNSRGRVVALNLLRPDCVTPLISDGGEVFYQLAQSRLDGLPEDITVPAREIIHDRWNCLFHPLVGLSPLYASATASRLGLNLEANAKSFFANNSAPGGILVAPGPIPKETAENLKAQWEENFSGGNAGRIAVVSDDLKFEPMRMSAVDAQAIEHLRWSAETVCSTFHVPAHMVGVGPQPTYNNVNALSVQYYTQCLQSLIEDYEASLADGLRVPADHRVQLDLDGLFRMDTASHIESLAKAVGAGVLAPDEARARLNLGPVPGGQHPYLQQQNYSLEALAQRGAPD